MLKVQVVHMFHICALKEYLNLLVDQQMHADIICFVMYY